MKPLRVAFREAVSPEQLVMPQKRWLRLDELENAIDNLETCAFLLENLQEPIRWKWGIIALHQALYGFAICAVRGTNSSSVLQDPANPESRLISVWESLKRTQDPAYLWSGAEPLNMSDAEERAISKVINEFRNGFEHFRPAGWSIEVSGMPQLFGHVLRVIEFLSLNSGAVRYYSEDSEPRVRAALQRGQRELRC